MSPRGRVVAVCRRATHALGKAVVPAITLLDGLGVEGDAHAGVTVQHRSRVARDPAAPNLRQVHLVHAELHERLRARGFDVTPGALGENVTTAGVPLLSLPVGARLHLGSGAVVELTGLRNPCRQLDGLAPGLMAAVIDRDASGGPVRLAGVMAVVIRGGRVVAGDPVEVELPPGPPVALDVV